MNEREKLKTLGELGTYAAMDTRLCKWADERITELEQQLAKREQQLADVQLTAILGQEEIARLKQQLAERETAKTPAKLVLDQMRRIGELEKQNVLLRDALTDEFIQWINTRCDETFKRATASDFPQHESSVFLDKVTEALAVTQDLAGLVVCDAKPVMKIIRNEAGQVVAQNGDGGYFSPFNYVGKSFYLAKEES